jgi:heme oxygenase
MPELRRAPRIHEDYTELSKEAIEPTALLPVVKEYMDYLMSISEDADRLMAHVYVRHMGDLFGGQMIAKKVPGLSKMYLFDRNKDELKTLIRERVNDSMADEAKVCFDFATKLFQQMNEAKK